jgi:hypothetical protein
MAARSECGRVQENDRNVIDGQFFVLKVREEMLFQHLAANAFKQASDAASVFISGLNESQVIMLLLTMDKFVKRPDLPERTKIYATLVNDATRELAFYRGVLEGEEPVPPEKREFYKLY